MKALLNWMWVFERSEDPDGEVNEVYRFFTCHLMQRWVLPKFHRWRHDGLPRFTVNLGPLMFNWGKDHHWLPRGEDNETQ